MRCPVFRLIWLKLIFSESDVAGNSATEIAGRGGPVGCDDTANTH
jgi:hypothetical protein